MRKKFIKFLKDNNALIPFVCNLAIIRKMSLTQLLNTSYIKKHPYRIIINTFIWNDTTEKYIYWNALDDKWQKECQA